MEFDADCVTKGGEWSGKVTKMFTGDQIDLNRLKQIGEEIGHLDVIFDDGGHSRKQQVNSLIGLWPFLKREGVYVIQDMYHSFVDQKNDVNRWYSKFNDNDESSVDLIMELIILYSDPSEVQWITNMNVNTVKPNISIRSHAVEINKSLLSINCFHRACVLHKK